MNPRDRSAAIKEKATALGFTDAGISNLAPNAHAEQFKRWLSSGMAATMTYMHRQAARRLEPELILPGATRAVVVLRNHYTMEPEQSHGKGRVAKYARGPDYHHSLREPLDELVQHMIALGDRRTIAKAYVDAGPVPERELARRAGLGWIGRNSMLIHPRFGSHLFIATVLTNLELELDEPFAADRCGSCYKCVESCPTHAIRAGRLVDSRQCLSYLTIEHKGEIPEALRERMGDRILGCDTCQDVCPWNKKVAKPADDPVLRLDSDFALLDLRRISDIDGETFARWLGDTPFERPGLAGLRRNARIVLENHRVSRNRGGL